MCGSKHPPPPSCENQFSGRFHLIFSTIFVFIYFFFMKGIKMLNMKTGFKWAGTLSRILKHHLCLPIAGLHFCIAHHLASSGTLVESLFHGSVEARVMLGSNESLFMGITQWWNSRLTGTGELKLEHLLTLKIKTCFLLYFYSWHKKDPAKRCGYVLPCTLVDLFQSLVVLWIVNIVNELIHLRHIIHQNPLYVPICP